jgi:putative methyltransferase (TIGR04325 family)
MKLGRLVNLFHRRSRSPKPTTDLTGDFASWQAAIRQSDGYDSSLILDRTADAVLKVKDGSAIFERDSVIFDRIEYSWPLLAALMSSAAQNNGALNVLDFGGSLGSTYFQNRRFLSSLPSVRWNIIEQPAHVAKGKAAFANEILHFYTSIGECVAVTEPKVAVLAAVLHYLENPFNTFQQITSINSISTVIIDRTPFWNGDSDRLCVQTVPDIVYKATYPSWVFSRDQFIRRVGPGWKILERFNAIDKLTGPVELSYEGMILTRVENRSS